MLLLATNRELNKSICTLTFSLGEEVGGGLKWKHNFSIPLNNKQLYTFHVKLKKCNQ